MSGSREFRLSTKVDWGAILEAAYAEASSDLEWGRRVVAAVQPLFVQRDWLGLVILKHPPDCSSASVRLFVGGGPAVAVGKDLVKEFPRLGRRGLRELYYPASIVATQMEIARNLSSDTREFLASFRADHGVRDAIGITFHPDPGIAAVLYGGFSNEVILSRYERKLLSQIALHLESGFRLRLRPGIVKAILTPDGVIREREQDAPSKTVLQRSVSRIERARLRKNRQSQEALDVWTALVEGRSSLVERYEGERRLYYVVENPLAAQPLRALTAAELDVVAQSARGLSAKLVAYSLGVSEGAVSANLASASRKLGLATRTELVRIAAMLSRDPRARFHKMALTAAERDVAELLASGLSNGEIASIRNRSVRTIANQVARLLQKTRTSSRRALAALPLESRAPENG